MAEDFSRQELLSVLTTEHFTLQGARSQTVGESALLALPRQRLEHPDRAWSAGAAWRFSWRHARPPLPLVAAAIAGTAFVIWSVVLHQRYDRRHHLQAGGHLDILFPSAPGAWDNTRRTPPAAATNRLLPVSRRAGPGETPAAAARGAGDHEARSRVERGPQGLCERP